MKFMPASHNATSGPFVPAYNLRVTIELRRSDRRDIAFRAFRTSRASRSLKSNFGEGFRAGPARGAVAIHDASWPGGVHFRPASRGPNAISIRFARAIDR